MGPKSRKCSVDSALQCPIEKTDYNHNGAIFWGPGDQSIDEGIDRPRRPSVMAAFGTQTKPDEWTVYLASSAPGSQSLVYNYDTRTRHTCGSIWDTVPNELGNVISQCSRNPTDRHMFDAKCGEINALINYYVRAGESVASLEGKDGRMVAWKGTLDEDLEYKGGNVLR